MAEHEPTTGMSDEWYTPPWLFEALGLTFDLDPCSPGPGHWVPAAACYTKAQDGLSLRWYGRVFMNPPFGTRNAHVPWLVKFLNHGDGLAIVRSYTSAAWFQKHLPRAECLLWPKGKTQFIRPDGSIGKSPGHGIVLVGMGHHVCNALVESGLGLCWDRR